MKNGLLIILCSVFLPFAARCQEEESDEKEEKRFDSPNVVVLLEQLSYEASYPIARDIRFIYASVLELKKKKFEPYLVTNEDKSYFNLTKKGVSGLDLSGQYQAFEKQGRTWLNKNRDSWSSSEYANYMSFQRSMEASMSAMHTYYSLMGAMSGLAYAWTMKEANALTGWAAQVTHCVGSEAPENAILHVNMMRLTKGERFKFHSVNDFLLTATLTHGDSIVAASTQAMQLWVNTKRMTVAPEDAVPYYESTASEEKLELLKPVAINGFTHRFALLLNMAIKDIYMQLEEM